MRILLMRSIARALGVRLDTIDVVILQDVPFLLQYNVMRASKIVSAENRAVQLDYGIEFDQQLEDEQPLLEKEATLMLNRILSHRARLKSIARRPISGRR